VAVRLGDVHPNNIDTLEASLDEPGIRTPGVQGDKDIFSAEADLRRPFKLDF